MKKVTYVDLGLPSGTLWATCNVGADTPEGYGDYFAWGETQPKTTYNWSTYRYCNGDYVKLTKYCGNSSYGYNGFTDDLTVLQPRMMMMPQPTGAAAGACRLKPNGGSCIRTPLPLGRPRTA